MLKNKLCRIVYVSIHYSKIINISPKHSLSSQITDQGDDVLTRAHQMNVTSERKQSTMTKMQKPDIVLHSRNLL